MSSAAWPRHSAARAIPVLVKISPDTAENDLLRSVDAAVEGGAAGVIATNTTSRGRLLESRAAAAEAGGLSGLPLKASANAICRLLFRHLGQRVPDRRRRRHLHRRRRL